MLAEFGISLRASLPIGYWYAASRPIGVTTNYVYSGGKVIAEYVNGTLTAEYIYAGSQLVATLDAGGNASYHYADQLSTRIETDASANVTRTYGHFPFGETWYETGNPDKWKFTSYERDAETGNDYAMAREYASTQGRFMQPDMLDGDVSDPPSFNHYAYVENMPIIATDPLGLFLVVPPGCYAVGDPAKGEEVQLVCPTGGGGGAATAGPGPGPVPGGNSGAGGPTQSASEKGSQSCQQQGQLSFNIPFTHIPVTVSSSVTFAFVNYSSTNDRTIVIGTWIPFVSLGGSVDLTVDAPNEPAPSVAVGAGKNLSLGTFLTPDGPQGMTASIGPSIGPPVTISLPAGNTCGKPGSRGPG